MSTTPSAYIPPTEKRQLTGKDLAGQPQTPRQPRCRLCGLGPHRYMFPTDLIGHHKPSEIACANSIIGLVSDLLGAEAPRAVVYAITNLAFAAGSGSVRRSIRESR